MGSVSPRTRNTAALAAGLFLLLAGLRNRDFWAYLLTEPGSYSWDCAIRAAWSLLRPWAAAGSLLFASWGIGRSLLRRFGDAGLRYGAPAALALGTGALSLSVFLLGTAGLYSRIVFGALLFPGVVCAGWEAFLRLRAPRPRAEAQGAPLPKYLWSLLGLSGFLAWHAALMASAPPTEWDSLAYHLALPKIYLSAGRILEIPWLLHSHWPHALEVLYGLPLSLGLDTVPALLHGALCAAWVLAVFQAGRRELDAESAWLGAALLAAQPVLTGLAGTPHSDGGFALFHFLGTLALWSWRGSGERATLALAGLFAGFAVSAKFLGLLPLAVLTVWTAFIAKGRGGWSHGLRSAGFYLALAAVPLAPWLLKTWLGAGNPVWPFLVPIFGGDWGAAAIAAPYTLVNSWSFPEDLGLLGRYGPSVLLGPLAALYAMGRLLGKRLPPFLSFLLLPLPFYLLGTIRHHEVWRFCLPFLPGLALSAAWLAAQLLKSGTRVRSAAAVLLAICLAPALTLMQNNELFAVLGPRSQTRPEASPRELYLDRALDHHRFFRAVNRTLPPSSKVLLFREIRGYYLDVPYMWGDPVNQGLLLYAPLQDDLQLRDRLRELGVTHVLLNRGRYPPSERYYTLRILGLMERMLRDRARPLLQDGPLELHELL